MRRSEAKSTRNRWPHGQEDLPSLQLIFVVKHHGVHPGYRTVLKGQEQRCGLVKGFEDNEIKKELYQ